MTYVKIVLSDRLGDEDMVHLEQTLRHSFALESICQAPDGVEVCVSDQTSSLALERTIKQIVRARLYYSNESIFAHVVSLHKNVDPQPALEAKGDVRMIAPGIFAFCGDFLRVRSALDAKVQKIAAAYSAVEMSYPALWPIPVLQSIDFFHDFPHLPMLVSGVEKTFEARDVFAERFRKAEVRSTISCTAENGIASAANVLAPTVCDCCYWLLRGRRDVGNAVFTMHGQVFRNESSPEGKLDRLTAYTMREIVMVGNPDFVLSHRDALIGDISALIISLDLECDIKAADDPFFCNDALKKSFIQNVNKLKYEVEIPLYGVMKTAVASINLHNDFFSRNYDYRGADSYPFSACVGFGYERLTYALFCRHGAELSSWPRSVLMYLELIQDSHEFVNSTEK